MQYASVRQMTLSGEIVIVEADCRAQPRAGAHSGVLVIYGLLNWLLLARRVSDRNGRQ